MRHDWIFDVLKDLRNYADKNGLPAIAQEAARALEVARIELSQQTAADAPPQDVASTPKNSGASQQ